MALAVQAHQSRHGPPLAGHGDPAAGHVPLLVIGAVDADCAVTAAPGSASLDGQAGSRVETVQLLTPEGGRLEHPDYPLEQSADEVKGLYRDLVLVRRMDPGAIPVQRQGELGIWASLLGQEAAQVGS